MQNHAERFWSRVEVRGKDDCWPWIAAINSGGYGQFRIDGKENGAHRVSWILANGRIPAGGHICHHCDNPSCVNPRHLFLGSNKINHEDKVAKKRHRFGASHPAARLHEDAVRKIKVLALSERTLASIAQQFKVSHATVSDIAKGRTWSSISDGGKT